MALEFRVHQSVEARRKIDSRVFPSILPGNDRGGCTLGWGSSMSGPVVCGTGHGKRAARLELVTAESVARIFSFASLTILTYRRRRGTSPEHVFES